MSSEEIVRLAAPAPKSPNWKTWIAREVGKTRWFGRRGLPGEDLYPGTATSPETYEKLTRQYLSGAGAVSTKFHEIQHAFASLAELLSWAEGNPWWVDDDYAQEIVADISHAGLLCPVGGYARPREITIGADFRETIVYRGLSSRMRAVLLLLLDMPSTADVYAPESVTPFATTLRNRFAGFIGSEYLPTAESRAKNHSVRHEDAMALSFLDASFDAYVSCEVMEHIPSPQKALEEAARVLRQGGRFVATFPFGPVNETSVIKATLGPDGPVFIGEPEIHGNPVDGEGSPVFTIPGWDIIDMARKAGFSQADMIAVTSRRYGIVGSGPVPIFVMRAVR